MTISELFVNIGIKGGDVAAKSLGGVKKGLGEISSMSLEAKAAIVGVVYGLERMLSASAQQGMQLQQFANYTGLSTDKLQRWQYAARQSGVSSQELTSSIQNVQKAMTNLLTGKGAPEGLGILARTVGFDISKARDSFYVLEKLKQAAKVLPADIGNQVLESFGVSGGVGQFLRTSKIDPSKIDQSKIYSRTEIENLAKVEVAWANLGAKVEMAFGKFNSAHGGQLTADLSKIIDKVILLTEAFVKLLETLHAFQAISKVFGGIASALESTSALLGNKESQNKWLEEYRKHQKYVQSQPTYLEKLANSSSEVERDVISPLRNRYLPHPTIPQKVEVNQTNYISGVENAEDVGKETKSSVTKAFQDLQQAQAKGS